MRADQPTAAERTAHPDLYAPTYWGRHRSGIAAAIIRNRNAFARAYGLRSLSAATFEWPTCAYSEIDHAELYRAADGKMVLACSNYGHTPPETLGMAETDPLYSAQCRSFCRVFNSLKELRETMRCLSRPAQGIRGQEGGSQ